jgi:hypothetical protein
MQHCQSCGLQAIPGARFCRQCGAPLFIETDETMAQTRHYRDRVAVPPAPGYQPMMPPGEDTSRFYHNPPAQLYTVPAPHGTSSNFWLMMALVSVLAIAGVAGAIFTNMRVNSRRPRPDIARAIEERIKEQAERQAEAVARQAEQAAKQAEIATRQAEQAAQGAIPHLPPLPPAPPVGPTGVRPVTAADQRLVYPKSTIEIRTFAVGNEIIKLRTSDGLDAIEKFYSQRLGTPPLTKNAEKMVYNLKDQGGNLLVTVRPHPSKSDEHQIQIIKTSFKTN